jgi:Predicted acetyltransferase
MTTGTLDIRYLPDAEVDAALDAELRELLSTCFTKPQDHVFRRRRYFNEMPAHRWLARDERDGRLVAHLAAHERTVLAGDRVHAAGGVAEVCVHPEYRGRGYAGRLVGAAHDWMRERGWDYSILFGEPRYYASSGYVPISNLLLEERGSDGATVRREAGGALVFPLGATPWPDGVVVWPGPIF